MHRERDRNAPKDRMNRFARLFSDQELLAVLADVARHATPNRPDRVTQASYDAARAPAGHPGTPRAQRLAERFRRPWAEAVALALDPAHAVLSISAREASGPRKDMTRAEVKFALTSIAKRLGVSQLSIHDYDTERERLVREDEDHWRHSGRLRDVLPAGQTIVAHMKTWELALALAGLKLRRPERLPAYPPALALADFIADHGFAPTRRMLLDYQARRGMATADLAGPWQPWVRGQFVGGAARFRGVEPVVRPERDAPAGWRDQPESPAVSGYELKRPARVTAEECERDTLRALDLANGQNLTQDVYQLLATRHKLVSLSSIQLTVRLERDMTWGQFRDDMVARRAKQTREQKRRSTRQSARPPQARHA